MNAHLLFFSIGAAIFNIAVGIWSYRSTCAMRVAAKLEDRWYRGKL